MKFLSKLTLGLFLSLSLSSCQHLSSPYELIAPFVQKDHEVSEFGYGALRETEDRTQWGKQKNSDFNFHAPKPLERGKTTYVILQVDGGGVMGITPSRLVAKIEAALQKRPGKKDERLCNVLSMCSGTSTGAVIAGGVAAGVPGEAIADFYYTKGYNLFQGKGRLPLAPILQHVLSREAFQQEFVDTLESLSLYKRDVRLGEMNRVPVLALAAYDLVGKRTVFLRNCDRFDAPVNTRDIQLIDAISASALSATVYFGKLVAPEVVMRHLNADGTGYLRKGAVFVDGGQGTQNSTIELAAIQALEFLKGDPDSQVALISLGCGNEYAARNFVDVLGYNGFDQVSDFLFRNQARSESILMQWLAAQQIEKLDDRLKVYRFDWENDTKKANAFEINSTQRQFLADTADNIAEREDFRQLLSDLSDSSIPLKQFRD